MKKAITLLSAALCAVGAWAEPAPEPEYVQLYENGPKWATMNLGATSVTDAGLYFWWGDVVGYTKDEKYNFYIDNTAITSYGNNYGYVEKGKLAAEKDAATQQLGEGYRIPTLAEFEDLYKKCTWTWQTNYNGVEDAEGYLITGKGKYEGNSIFLPAAGYRLEDDLSSEEIGLYWSSTPHSDGAIYAYCLNFNPDVVFTYSSLDRVYGFPVRPVYEDPNYLSSLIGDKCYKYESYVISVNEEGAIQLIQPGQEPFIPSELYVQGNEYTFMDMGVRFVVEDEAIAHVYVLDGAGTIAAEFVEYIPESKVIALMGNNVYYNAESGAEVYVDEDHHVSLGGMPIGALGMLSKDGDDYVIVYNGLTVKLIVKDGEVATVEVYNDSDVDILVKKDPFAEITIGEETIKYTGVDEFKTAIEAIEGVASIKFVDNIAEVSLVNLYLSSSSDITIDLNGKSVDNIYFNVCGKLTINDSSEEETGMVTFDPAYPFDVNEGAELIINGGSFYGSYYVNGGEGRVILNGGHFKEGSYGALSEYAILGEGKALKLKDGTIITEITETITQDCEVIDAPSTPTAIESVNAEKSGKVVKTIEDGKVVIIRGDKKYDLSGREL